LTEVKVDEELKTVTLLRETLRKSLVSKT
jgi:hypothetical protein